MNKQAKNPITDLGEYINMIISIIYICFYCTMYITIFFFTLTTYVEHGDVNINVMLMSMLYNVM